MSAVRPLRARVARVGDAGHWGVEFAPDPGAKVDLVRKLFSGRYVDSVQSMGTLAFARALLRRAFG
jgi:hypothetical protein